MAEILGAYRRVEVGLEEPHCYLLWYLDIRYLNKRRQEFHRKIFRYQGIIEE